MSAALDPSWDILEWSGEAWALLTPYILAASAVAFRYVVRHRRQPALTLALGNVQMAATVNPDDGTPGPTAAYGRLLVSNAARRDAADAMHVLVVGYRRIQPPIGDVVRLRMPLAWTHSTPTDTIATVHGGSPRYIDLVSTRAGVPIAVLETHPETAGPPLGYLIPVAADGQTLIPTTWQVELELVAKGVAPRQYSVDIAWDGAWQTGPIDGHLVVGEPIET